MLLWTRTSVVARRARPTIRLRLEPLEGREVPAVSIGQNFAGGSASNLAPPDTNGSVGPNHYAQFINGRFAVYNKATGAQVQAISDSTFWTNAGLNVGSGLSDTRIHYDPLSGRWFAVEITTANSGNLVLVARSDTNNPAGAWKATSYQGNTDFADYPTLGVDANAVYIGTNNFNANGLKSVTMTSIPKADLLLSTPTVANRKTNEQTSFLMGATLQGVTNFDPNPAHASIVAVNAFNLGRVNRTTITGTDGPNPVYGGSTILTVAGTSRPGRARQPDTTRVIDGLDDRIGSMVYQVGDLIYLVHGISVNNLGAAVTAGANTTDAVRLTVIRDSTTTVVAEQTWFNTGFDYIDPSVAANAFGDILIGYTRSSSTLGSGATDGRLGAYAVSARIDPNNPTAGITFGTELQLKAGGAQNYHLFNSVPERWGDYSATAVDPTNPLAFWTTQEWAVSGNPNNAWGTQISQVFFSPRVFNVSSTKLDGTYGAGTVIPITVAFTNPVTVTGNPRIALNSGGAAVYASGSGTSVLTFNYTVAAGESSPDLDYTSTTALTLNGGTINDLVSGLDAELTLAAPGTAGSLGANKNIIIDAQVPRVSGVTSPASNGTYGIGAIIPITVTFTRSVAVTGTPQLALNSGGTALFTGGSGTASLTFTYTVLAGENSADLDYSSIAALTLNGGTIQEVGTGRDADLSLPAPGGAGSLGGNKDLVIDSASARVTNVTSPVDNGTYVAGNAIPVAISFSNPVAVTGIPQLALNSGGTAVYTGGDGTTTLTFTYTVGSGQISPDLDAASTAALTLNGGSIKNQSSGQDAALTVPAGGTAGSLGANKDIVVDGTPPRITGVSSPAANGVYATGAVIDVTVQFNKAVTVTGAPQLALNSGGTATYASGTGTTKLTFTYTVGPGQASPDLDYTSTTALTLNGGTITEVSSGQDASLSLPAPGAFGSLGANKNIVIVIRPLPTVITSPAADGTYHVGATIPVTIQFTRAVLVVGSPVLALNSGGTATYASGTGSNTLTFNYTVAAGQGSADLDYTSASALSLNGGSIKDLANGVDADLTLPAPGAVGSLGANKDIVIETRAFATGVTSPAADGVYPTGNVLPITVAFDAAVVVTGSPSLALNSGGTAVYTGGSGTSVLTFTYTVASGQNSADLDYTSSTALALNGGTIRDVAGGQDAVLALPDPGAAGSLGANKNIVIDTAGPVVLQYRVLFGLRKYNLLDSTRFDLPWRVTGIQVFFSEPVMTGNIHSLTGVTATSFTGLRTRLLTFRFPALIKGSFDTALADSGPAALKDNLGNPIASFSKAFKVLYGDFTDDGVVDAADEAGVRANIASPYQLSPTGYNIFADLSGDGIVNLIDVGIARTRKGQAL